MKKIILLIGIFGLGLLGTAIDLSEARDLARLNPVASGGGASWVPTDIAGMTYYWNYTDITENTAVANWTDRINSVLLGQSDANSRPTNTATGVRFYGLDKVSYLTNGANISLPSSFSLWLVFNSSENGAYSTLFIDSSLNGFSIYNNNNNYYNSTDHAIHGVKTATWYSFVWANGATWTNGVSATTVTPHTVNGLKYVGWDRTYAKFKGYIKYIGVWTNTVLSATDATNLYLYSSSH